MIGTNEYKQLLMFFNNSEYNNSPICRYRYLMNINLDEAIEVFDELRKLHLKYKKECDLFTIYRNLDLKLLNLLKSEIEEFCIKYKLIVIFKEQNTLDYKKGFHCYYSFQTLNITELIIFNKKLKNE